MSVIPPLLEQRQRAICGWINKIETVGTGWEGRLFSRSVVTSTSEWWQEVGKRGVVLVDKSNGSCVKSELYGDRDLGCGWVVGVGDGVKCLSK